MEGWGVEGEGMEMVGGWREGEPLTKSLNRVNWDFLTKSPTTPASYCITDSLSHTTYVETNKHPDQ